MTSSIFLSNMELTYKHTKIYDWVGDDELRNSIMKGIDEIEKSNLLQKKSGYESGMSVIYGWQDSRERYKDANLPDGTGVEIKKDKTSRFIVDAIRYAEMHNCTTTEAVDAQSGIHLFINYKNGKTDEITRIMIVPNWMVVRMVIENKEEADMFLMLNRNREEKNQTLNCQAYLKVAEMIKTFNEM